MTHCSGLAARFLDHTGDDVHRAVGTIGDWHGEGADAAFAYFKDVRSDCADAVECLEKVPRVLRTLADEVSTAQRELGGAIETVESNQYLRMRHDGKVYLWEGLQDSSSPTGGTGPDIDVGDSLDKEQREEYQQLADWLNQQVQLAVDSATDADEVADAALKKLTPTAAGLEREVTGSDDTVAAGDIPDGDASPSKVQQWWNGLNPAQRESVLHHHGDKIGALDGIPVTARDRANRAKLAEDYNRVKTQAAEYQELGDQRTEEQQDKYDKLKGKLKGMNAIHERLNPDDDFKGPPAYLMNFSPKGKGRAAVAAGNPDTADNIATSVPGVGSDLAGIDTDLTRSEKLRLHANNRPSGGETAAVTWLGYDAPSGIDDAIFSGPAEDGAGDLRNFQDGLRETHEGAASNNTLIGHSYGSTVIGNAAQDGDAQLDADNAVFVGSPGVDAWHESQLQLPEDADVYASTARHDAIRLTPLGTHGMQPMYPAFGAENFDSDPGTAGSAWYTKTAHSEYWKNSSKSLKSMAQIVNGEEPN